MLLLFCTFIAWVNGQTVGETGWSTLQTTWSLSPRNGFFEYHTLEPDAKADKDYVLMMKCGDNGAPGNVYSIGGDLSSMPYYRLGDGKIGGIILGMMNPGASSEKPPFVQYTTSNGTSFWGVEAHFRDPSTMCTEGTSDDIWVGDRLWFKIGDSSYYKAPLNESKSALNKDGWVYGACFFKMGYHWWRYISVDMNCNDSYPIFLLYNKGKLNAWGVVMSHDDRPYLTSDKWEHPKGSQLGSFFQKGQMPTCLANETVLTSQHVYMTDPSDDECPLS